MADRYDDRRYDDRFYGRDWYDRDQQDWQRDRERMDREAQSRDDRSGYRLGDTDTGRWRDPMQGSGRFQGQDDQDRRFRDQRSWGGRDQDQNWSGRPDRWRSSDQGGYGQDYGRTSGSGMSGYDDRDRSGRFSGDMNRQSGFDNYSGAGRDWGSDQGRTSSGRGWDNQQDRDFSGYGASSGQDRSSFQGGRATFSARGEHAGKGPRGYQRSDDRIREEVSDQLSDHDDIDASNIEVNVQGGEVTLTGTVSDRGQKRMAEDSAERVRGVKDVHNQLRVQQDARQNTGQGGIMGQQMQGTGTPSSGEPMTSSEVVGNTAQGNNGLTQTPGQSNRNPKG